MARRVGVTDWPSTFLHLTAESPTIGRRDLDVLTTMHEKRREFGAGRDRRSHLAAAVECLIGSMLITPKQLAAELAITEQAITGILRSLQFGGLIREVTGRQSFRAFSLKGTP